MNNENETISKSSNQNSLGEVKKKQQRNLLIVFAVSAAIVCFLYFVLSDGSKKTDRQQENKTEFASAIKHVDAGSVLIERTEGRLARAEKQAESLQKNIEELNKEKLKQEKLIPEEQEKMMALMKRIEELENKIEQEQSISAQEVSGNVFPGVPGQQAIMPQAGMPQGIRDDEIVLARREEDIDLPYKNSKNYVSSGTFVKAVALGGADASAAVNSQSNPQPMLFKIIEQGTMPNNQKSRLKGCLATAAVVGDISSERGFIRLETLSCVEPKTKRVLDLNVEGTVFGPEGKSGIRGTPMWREGALLQRAFAAGALSGLAGGLSQKYTQTAISPLGAIQSSSGDVKDILAQGAASGLGNAMEKLADYNIKRAEQYHPVLQLSAGTVVDIVFLKGFFLNDPKQEKDRQSMKSTVMQSTTVNSSHMQDNYQIPVARSATPTRSTSVRSVPFTSNQVAQLKNRK